MRHRWAKLTGRSLVTGCLVLAGTAVAAVPAAGVPGLTRIAAATAADSTTSKEALAQCPSGTRVLGGGGYIDGGGGYVHLTRLQALGSSDRFAAAAAEHGSYGGDWRVVAYAICGREPAGLVYPSFHTGTDSSGFKSATASCPGRTQLISTGARTTGGGGQVVIDDLAPSASLTWQQTTAYEDADGYAGDWSLWAHAVCAEPLPGLELRTATGLLPPTQDFVTVEAVCPPGTQLHGLGGSISGGIGKLSYGWLYPPGPGLDRTAVRVGDLEPEHPTGWLARAYAICAA